ncbi:MAG: UDP-N-acetylmuramate dehydrogenase [Saprospiraceae bacterium]
MNIRKNVSLQPYNTFGLDAQTSYLAEIDSEETFLKTLALAEGPLFILGGGSNLLLKNDWKGTVLLNQIKGKSILETSENEVLVKIGGGENWHQFVLWCLENDFGGVENLSLIPGTVGASPIQNIGAYGVELKDVFVKLEAIHLDTGKIETYDLEDCKFGYRDSIFKQELKGKVFISQVYLKLTKKEHSLNTSYGAISQVLESKGIDAPSIRDISNAVIEIRSSKLPDPKELGNSGSFFKNPEIGPEAFESFHKKFPDAPFYPLENGDFKIPAGWLIEQAGWKGKKVGNTGSHKDQALVLVNYGGASGEEIWNLALAIQQSVVNQFGIEIFPEVNVIG